MLFGLVHTIFNKKSPKNTRKVSQSQKHFRLYMKNMRKSLLSMIFYKSDIRKLTDFYMNIL